MSERFDREVDVLVVGAGAGGMTAALTAKAAGLETLLIEKAPVYGGTTALSGGGMWVPNHPALLRQGQRDDPAQILDYLVAIAGDRVRRERLEAYVWEAPKMAEFLESRSTYLSDSFEWTRGYSDYHPDRGGNPEGRGVWPKPIDLRELGDDADKQRKSTRQRGGPLPKGAWLTAQDLHDVIRLRWQGGRKRAIRALGRLGKRIVRHRLLGERMAPSGQALVARLRLALRENDVELLLETPLTSLICDGRGGVTGAVTERGGQELRIRARRGVILATGGFEHNHELRARYHPEVEPGWSLGSRDNTGDGIRAGEEIGAATDLMDDAWWMPSLKLNGVIFPLLPERQYPGQFIVNSAGRRFVNESCPYTDFVHAQLEGERTGVSHIPAYMIFDDRAWKRNFIVGHVPGRPMPETWRQADSVFTAESLDALAAKIGVPPDALRETAARFNEFARNGTDEDFHRGESAYDNYYGDQSCPNPNLAEVSEPPFYALELIAGDLGTKGGLLTDEHARVLRPDGSPIEGLFATGNASASVMGNDYAGPGATIGPAMTFGYVAARYLAQR